MKFHIVSSCLLSLFYFSLIETKLFAPNTSEFEDDIDDDDEYTAVNKSKMKLSKQHKMMEKFMKANSHSLTVKLTADSVDYLHVSGTQITFTCYGDEEIYKKITVKNNSKIQVDWRKDVLDIEENDQNFRLTIYKDSLVLQPSITNDTGYYQCVIDNEVIGKVSIVVGDLGDSIAEGLICMMILSASGFLPFLCAIIIRHFFAGKRQTLAEIERQQFLKRQKQIADYEKIEFEEDEDQQLKKMVDDYYFVYSSSQQK